ncbi:MAG: hypothetical protein ACKO5E_01270, partial [bacterium]
MSVRQQVLPFQASEPATIEGGFVTIPVQCLMMAWWAFRTRQISRTALRAYFACHELESRRKLLLRKYKREYHRLIPDFVRLMGGTTKQGRSENLVRSAFRELQAIGLVRSGADSAFHFAAGPDELGLADNERRDLIESLGKVSHLKRPVPVPRRILRRLAGGMSRSRTGVLVAYLIRCLYYRKGEGVTAKGCCKASWIADTFGISERSVFDARDYLINDLGWLHAVASPQRVMNRHGLWVSVNLNWKNGDSARAVISKIEESHPTKDEPLKPVQNFKSQTVDNKKHFADPPAHFACDFADPLRNNVPSFQEGSKNQNHPQVEPTMDFASGFYQSEIKKEPETKSSTQKPEQV